MGGLGDPSKSAGQRWRPFFSSPRRRGERGAVFLLPRGRRKFEFETAGHYSLISVKKLGHVTAASSASKPRLAPWQWLEERWRRGWLFALFLVIATLIAYQPIWHAGYIWDDGILLLENDMVKRPDGWWQLWFTKGVDFVPVTISSFWLEWRLWGAHPLGYHLDNVILHGLCAGLVWRVLKKLDSAGSRLAAAIFALHPVNVASVAWIAERKNTLAMACFLCSLLWYLRFEKTGRAKWYGLAVLGFMLAILSKTAVAPLPLVLLGFAWWKRGRISLQDLKRSLPFFALAAAASALAFWSQSHAPNAIARTGGFWMRLGLAGQAFWFYVGKALVPIHLIPVYPLWHFDPTQWTGYLPGFAVLAVFAVCWFCRKQGSRALLFGFGYYLVMLLPVLGFVNIALMRFTLVADQWHYFALPAPIALVAAGLTRAMQFSGKVRIVLQAVVCGFLLVSLDVLTYKQCFFYTNQTTLWEATVAANPQSFLAHSGLAGIRKKEGKIQQAIAEYTTALTLEPRFDDARYDFANLYLETGHPARAAAEYKKILAIEPDYARAVNNLAWILATSLDASVRDGAQAVMLARHADQLADGKNPNVLSTLAASFAEAGQFPEAMDAAERAVKLSRERGDTPAVIEFEHQLELYKKGQPYRDPIPLPSDSGTQ